MNRPFWLDSLRVVGFLIPPIVIAAAATGILARRLGWPGPVWALADLIAVPIAIVLWLAALVAWARWRDASRYGPDEPD